MSKSLEEQINEYIVSTLKELENDPYKEAVFAGTKAFTKIFFYKTGVRNTKLSDEAMSQIYQLVYNSLLNVAPEIQDILGQDKGRFAEGEE